MVARSNRSSGTVITNPQSLIVTGGIDGQRIDQALRTTTTINEVKPIDVSVSNNGVTGEALLQAIESQQQLDKLKQNLSTSKVNNIEQERHGSFVALSNPKNVTVVTPQLERGIIKDGYEQSKNDSFASRVVDGANRQTVARE